MREDPAGDPAVARHARGRIDGAPVPSEGAPHELVSHLLVEQDAEARAGDGALEDRECAIEELGQVEDRVELRHELRQDRELAARADHHLLGGLDHAARLEHRGERVHHRRVVPSAGKLLDLDERLIQPARRPIGTVGHHRLVRDRDAEDARRERNRLARQPVRVARAVPMLIGVADDRHDAAQEADRFENARAQDGMLLHDLFLVGRERAGLRQDRGGHANLPERVEERRVAQVTQLVV